MSAEQAQRMPWWRRLPGLRGLGAEPAVDVLPVRVGVSHYQKSSATPAHVLGLDTGLLWAVVLLLAFSLVMVYSASIAMPDNPRFGKIAPSHFLSRHALAIGVGFVGALLTFQVPLKVWERLARPLFLLSIVLLVAVLIPHVGTVVNGSRRWIGLGVMNFQPSELTKFAILMYAANFMDRKMELRESFLRSVVPMVVAVAGVGALLLLEPDMGAFMVIAIIAMGILFLGGVNMRMLVLIGVVMVAAFALIVMTSPWRRERIFAYLDPFSEAHALGKGYQLSHALIAIGRGQIFGAGLGASVEKLHWLPEAHTDFLLAVIGEELGLVGVLSLIIAFFWLTKRIMFIGRQAVALDRVFPGLVAQGVAIWFGFQSFINMGVNLGALPTKGLTLPFISFGGSAILMNLIAIAVVLRIDYENKLLMRGERI